MIWSYTIPVNKLITKIVTDLHQKCWSFFVPCDFWIIWIGRGKKIRQSRRSRQTMGGQVVGHRKGPSLSHLEPQTGRKKINSKLSETYLSELCVFSNACKIFEFQIPITFFPEVFGCGVEPLGYSMECCAYFYKIRRTFLKPSFLCLGYRKRKLQAKTAADAPTIRDGKYKLV